MTKKSRTILFFICLFFFVLTAVFAVFYSQGYRIDWANKKFTQTGAFYFKVLPKSAEVYLDGKFKKKTDYFFGSLLTDNLLPKKYIIEIKKEGYWPWKKSLEIKEKQVTELKNIVLIPQNPNFTLLNSKTADFFFSPDGKKIVLKETGDKGFALKLFDLDKNIKSSLIEENDFKKYFATSQIKNPKLEFLNLTWSFDNKEILLNIAGAEQIKYFIVETDNTSPRLISLDFLAIEVENIQLHPSDSQKIFFAEPIPSSKKGGKSQIGLFSADYKTKEVSSSFLSDFLAYQATREGIFWLSSDGFLFKSDLNGKNQEKLNLDPLPQMQEQEIQFYIKPPKILLKADNVLYAFDSNSKNFKKIFEPVKSVEFSEDLKKTVFYNDSEIWILFLEKNEDQPQKEYLEQLFISRFSEKIDRVFWFTDHYLIFSAGNKIKISEIDERDQTNIVDLNSVRKDELSNGVKEVSENENLRIFYNQKDGKLYIQDKNNLLVSDKLIK